MAHTILYNANVHTLDPHQPHATALALRNGDIVAVGSDAEIRTLAGPGIHEVDLAGRTVLPGLTDAHLHFEWYAFGLQDVDAETDTLDAALERVRAKAATLRPGQWILGYGWNHNVWNPGGVFPSAADLDRVAPANPVFLQAKSGHAAWVNTLALKLCGVTAETADPPGGHIERDASTGAAGPTGILLEDAMNLVQHQIPERTAAQLADAMPLAQANAWRAGLTGVHDFDGPRGFSAWQMLRERGQLGLRVVKQLHGWRLDQALALGLRSGFGDDWLRLGNVKVFADGALGPRTAAMIEPYLGEPSNYGLVVTDKEALHELAMRAAGGGLALSVHAIGDKANHDVLDVFASLRRAEKGEERGRLRHRIEHVQVLHPSDYRRLGQLKIIASMQPLHATSDMVMADKYWGGRSAGAYAWRTQLDAGAVLAFGSDCPVENFNPFWGIHAAVTRRRADGTPGPEGWYGEQRVTVAEAVRGYTLGPAYAGHMEHRLGSLTPGKLADLIVIDRDIFTCDPMAIRDTQVLGTMVGGEWKLVPEIA
jgi:predicted amidohydrolase YtcJ